MFQSQESERKVTLEKERDERRAKYELEMTTLNENLTTLRVDLSTAQTRLQDTEKANDELKGEKLG